MWGDWMQNEYWERVKKIEEKRIAEEVELEDKIFRISHPILESLGDLKTKIGLKIAGIE